MKATELLKQQHEEVKTMFQELEKSSAGQERRRLFEELATSLMAHDLIEREIFYPACEAEADINGLVGEALAEHEVMHFGLYQTDQAKNDGFSSRCSVLKEIVSHHVEEEEGELFPKIEKKIGKQRLEELGALMRERFHEASAEDYRGVLRESLQQAMNGLMSRSNGSSSRRKTSKKTAPKRSSGASSSSASSRSKSSAGGNGKKQSSRTQSAR